MTEYVFEDGTDIVSLFEDDECEPVPGPMWDLADEIMAAWKAVGRNRDGGGDYRSQIELLTRVAAALVVTRGVAGLVADGFLTRAEDVRYEHGYRYTHPEAVTPPFVYPAASLDEAFLEVDQWNAHPRNDGVVEAMRRPVVDLPWEVVTRTGGPSAGGGVG